MKQYIAPEVLKQRQRDCYERLGFFLFGKNVLPRARELFGRLECLSLLHRLVGGQAYDANLKTVLFVIKQYASYRWMILESRLWWFSQTKVYRRTPEQIEAIIHDGEPMIDEEEDEEWPEVVS